MYRDKKFSTDADPVGSINGLLHVGDNLTKEYFKPINDIKYISIYII